MSDQNDHHRISQLPDLHLAHRLLVAGQETYVDRLADVDGDPGTAHRVAQQTPDDVAASHHVAQG